jgi:hypothetical protein
VDIPASDCADVLMLVAKHPLEYKIRLYADGSEHVVSSACLEPSILREEKDDGQDHLLAWR